MERGVAALHLIDTKTLVLITLVWAIAAYLIGIELAIVDVVLSIAGFSIGLLLGLYALGLIAPQTSQNVAIAAFVVGAAVTCYVAFGTNVYGYWYTLVGSTTIVVAGLILGMIFPKFPKPDVEVIH